MHPEKFLRIGPVVSSEEEKKAAFGTVVSAFRASLSSRHSSVLLTVLLCLASALIDKIFIHSFACTALPRSADPCRRLARSKNTPFYQRQPPRGTVRQTVNSRQPSLCGCGSTHLENTLPTDVVAASSLSTFRRLLKRFLFKQSSGHHLLTSSS